MLSEEAYWGDVGLMPSRIIVQHDYGRRGQMAKSSHRLLNTPCWGLSNRYFSKFDTRKYFHCFVLIRVLIKYRCSHALELSRFYSAHKRFMKS